MCGAPFSAPGPSPLDPDMSRTLDTTSARSLVLALGEESCRHSFWLISRTTSVSIGLSSGIIRIGRPSHVASVTHGESGVFTQRRS